MNSRWPPLEPEFVVARGEAGRVLGRALLAAPARLGGLRGLVSGEVLAITGTELPWVDGAQYFGRDGAASWLLVPTHEVHDVPTSWLERSYRAALPQLAWPCLLLPAAVAGARVSLLPVGRVGALHPPLLQAWCER